MKPRSMLQPNRQFQQPHHAHTHPPQTPNTPTLKTTQSIQIQNSQQIQQNSTHQTNQNNIKINESQQNNNKNTNQNDINIGIHNNSDSWSSRNYINSHEVEGNEGGGGSQINDNGRGQRMGGDGGDSVREIRVVNFKQIFQIMGICFQLCVTKEIYVPEADRYYQFQQLTDIANCVPVCHTTQQILLLRFTYITDLPQLLLPHPPFFEPFLHPHPLSLLPSRQSINQQNIKQRDRSRTIGQVLEHVRKWRYLAQEGINGRKLNLQQAAHYIGIPKKSLDDYFYQVRVGEKYQFPFQLHANKNISYLRKFVKDKVPNRHRSHPQIKSQQAQPQKLPKKLKPPIESQPLPTPPSLSKSYQSQPQHTIQKQVDNQSQKGRISDSEVSSLQPIWPNTFLMKQDIFDEQDSFFNHFKDGKDNYVGFGYLQDKPNI